MELGEIRASNCMSISARPRAESAVADPRVLRNHMTRTNPTYTRCACACARTQNENENMSDPVSLAMLDCNIGWCFLVSFAFSPSVSCSRACDLSLLLTLCLALSIACS